MTHVQTILVGVFAVALLAANELVPRMTAARHGGAFAEYAVKNLRPWVYALSFGVFCGVGFFSGPGNGFLVGAVAVLAAYVIGARAYTAR